MMPKIRHYAAALILALAATLLAGTPANAAMTSTGCDWAVSGWSSVKVCITITYHQPTASKYQIDKVKVEASSVADTDHVKFSLILWDDGEAPGWNRSDQTLNAGNNWDKVYTPTELYVTVAGNNDGITCWGSGYFNVGGVGDFYAGADV